MASEAQIAANRANALKSTGPRTPEGKTAVAANSITHGLTARTTIVHPAEDPHEFHIFHDAMLADLAPESPVDLFEAKRIIANAWRLQRIPAVETSIHAESYAQVSESPSPRVASAKTPHEQMAISWLYDAKTEIFRKIGRHEVQLHRMFTRDLAVYMERQAKREAARRTAAREAEKLAAHSAEKRPLNLRMNDLLTELEDETNKAWKQFQHQSRQAPTSTPQIPSPQFPNPAQPPNPQGAAPFHDHHSDQRNQASSVPPVNSVASSTDASPPPPQHRSRATFAAPPRPVSAVHAGSVPPSGFHPVQNAPSALHHSLQPPPNQAQRIP